MWNFELGRTSRGTRLMRKARKYQRPVDLEDPHYYGVGPKPEVKSKLQSIEDRGFAKELPAYRPPENAEGLLQKICKKVYGSSLNASWEDQQLSNPLLKFKVLTKCIETFRHNIPNSLLHNMTSVRDLLTYYQTPIRGCTPFDALARDADKLPANFHVTSEVRFNPSTDTFFDGVTAFPGRKRILHTKSGQKFEKVVEWPHV
ncbi:hypothetical protein JTE90_008261 [Oedothorax gibbosus]|uniref:Large ribosomal subunit protein mL50 n=1 Tax=Oedothorax gibbosus TaxID=931172 RepID=A0AAV6UI51_9ARAC|nr:hypothetical protein JTE90_008261 [Oedothorax gibbosus]